MRAKPTWIPKQDDTWIRKILWGQTTDKSQGENIFEELQTFSNPKGVDVTYMEYINRRDQVFVAHGTFPVITYFDMLYVGRTWITRIYIIYIMFVGQFCLSSSLCCNSLSGVLFLEIKGDEMWSLYAEKLRLLAERFEEAPRQNGYRWGLLDFWGGWWILGCQGRLMDIECLLMDHGPQCYNQKPDEQMRVSLDGLRLVL